MLFRNSLVNREITLQIFLSNLLNSLAINK